MTARIGNLVWKELLQLARDWLLTTFLFVLPMLQLVLLARATGRGVKEQPVVILDLDRSAVTRELAVRLDNREELAVTRFVEDERALEEELERGEARAGVIFPSGFAGDLSNPTRAAPVRVVVDGSSDAVAGIVQSAVETVFADYTRQRLAEQGIRTDPAIDLRVVTYYNPTYDVRQFTIPAQVGFITYQITLVIASLGLARERELGTLEGLIVTPLSRTEIVLGKAIPAFLIGLVNFLFLVAVARFGFHVPMRGSFLLLLALTVPFLLAEIGWGGHHLLGLPDPAAGHPLRLHDGAGRPDVLRLPGTGEKPAPGAGPGGPGGADVPLPDGHPGGDAEGRRAGRPGAPRAGPGPSGGDHSGGGRAPGEPTAGLKGDCGV
jgi:ABC-2 type transport system permease protein